MTPINNQEELFKKINSPGVIGVLDDGKVVKVNTCILIHTPVIHLIKAMHQGHLFSEEPCKI